MKKIIIVSLLVIISQNVFSQSNYQKVSKIIESLGNIRIATQTIRNNADSLGIFILLDSLDIITNELENQVNKIVVNDKPKETDISMIDTFKYDDIITEDTPNTDDHNGTNDKYSNRSDYYNQLLNASKRKKVYLELQHGFVGLKKDNSILNIGANTPDHETTNSTYWDISLKVRNKLSKSDSSAVSFIYGLGYSVNGYANSNDMRLTMSNDMPEYVKETDLRNDARVKVGYLYLPLELEFSLSRKIRLGIGGFGGYRVKTNQILGYRINKETIDVERSGDYKLNNWNYGGSANISLSSFGLVFKYHASPVFQENKNFNYNAYTIGLNIKL